MRVEDVMTCLVVTLRPADTVHEAARRLAQNHISGAPVVDDGRVVGVVTEYDLLRAGAVRPVPPGIEAPSQTDAAVPTVASVMTTRVFAIRPDTSVWHAAALLGRQSIKRLPVVGEDGYLVGVVARADLVRAMGRDDGAIREDALDTLGVLGDAAVSEVTVTVTDGVATLGGRAPGTASKEMAVKLVARVPGVLEAKDSLRVETIGVTGLDDA